PCRRNPDTASVRAWRRRWRLIGGAVADPGTDHRQPIHLGRVAADTDPEFHLDDEWDLGVLPRGMDRSSGDRALDGSPGRLRIHPPRYRRAARPGPDRPPVPKHRLAADRRYAPRGLDGPAVVGIWMHGNRADRRRRRYRTDRGKTMPSATP